MQEIIKGPFMHWEPPNPFFVPEFADGHPTGQSQGTVKLFLVFPRVEPLPSSGEVKDTFTPNICCGGQVLRGKKLEVDLPP